MPHRPPRQHKHNTSTNCKSTKSQRLDAMARKKDERAARKKERKAASNFVTADDKSFAAQLATVGLKIREVIVAACFTNTFIFILEFVSICFFCWNAEKTLRLLTVFRSFTLPVTNISASH